MSAVAVWTALAAGLGGALIGGIFALLGGWTERRSRAVSSRRAAKQAAYASLLSASALVVHTADTLRLTKQVRSGLIEGLNVTLRLRSAPDPMGFYLFVRQDFEPLYRAWADVWAVGSPEAVRLANDLLNRAGEVIQINTQAGKQHRGLWWWLFGEAWTPEQLDEIHAKVVALADIRRELGDLARRELGVEAADLFASSDTAEGEPVRPRSRDSGR